ncbi:MAG: helix-turn-helix domain-containing protein [Muribaculaceae bacterium]|nr:helix-turn-helix domain-containing protein [Muribaculaceae bacterium]
MVAEVLEASEKKNDDDIIWLSPETVCERLGVTRPTLWRWEKENYLTPTRFGRRTRYRLSDVERIKGAERK